MISRWVITIIGLIGFTVYWVNVLRLRSKGRLSRKKAVILINLGGFITCLGIAIYGLIYVTYL